MNKIQLLKYYIVPTLRDEIHIINLDPTEAKKKLPAFI